MILSSLDHRILSLTGERDLPRTTIMRQCRLAGYTALETTHALDHLGLLDLIERVGHISQVAGAFAPAPAPR